MFTLSKRHPDVGRDPRQRATKQLLVVGTGLRRYDGTWSTTGAGCLAAELDCETGKIQHDCERYEPAEPSCGRINRLEGQVEVDG